MFTKNKNLVIIRILLAAVLFAGGLGIRPAQAGAIEFGWANSLGIGSGFDIYIDASGNLYSTGSSGVGISINKLDNNGNSTWFRSLVGWGVGFSVVADGEGNVLATGPFQNTVDFDPGPGTYELTSSGGRDVFIVKLDANGDFVWARKFGGVSVDEAYKVAVDGNGSVYTTGTFFGTVDFDPGAGTYDLTSAGPGNDIFIFKLDVDGNFLWAKNMEVTGGGGIGMSIALDGDGNIYVTGADGFISKLDNDGNFVWAQTISGSGIEIALDDMGNVYATGLDPVFINKLNTNGDLVWAKTLGGSSDIGFGYGIALDKYGNVFTTGSFIGTIDFDPGDGVSNLTSAGDYDIFISKLDTNGNFGWAKSIGGVDDDSGEAIAVDDFGNVYLTGEFSGTVDFDPDAGIYNLTSTGSQDAFVSKFVFTPQVHYVTKTADTNDGACDGDCSLREAIADAVSGDIIKFDSSLAGGTITLASDQFIDKDVTIDGSGLSPQVTISGGNIAHIEIDVNFVTISDLTIANGYTNIGGGAIRSGGFLTIVNSTLRNNYSSDDCGAIESNGSLTVKNTTIYQNMATYKGGAICIANNLYDNTIVNSTITRNQAGTSGGAIYLYGSGEGTIFNSTLALNNATSSGSEIYIGGIAYLTAYNTIIACSTDTTDACAYGVYLVNSIAGTGTLADIGLAELANNGGPTQTMAIYGDSPLIDAGDNTVCANVYVNNLDQRGVSRLQGAHCDIGAYEDQVSVIYVKQNAMGANDGSSWTDAYTDLQSALSAASAGDEIWVAAGTFRPTSGADRTVSFVLKNGVAVYGGFAGGETQRDQRNFQTNVTVLSGDIDITGNISDNSYHVVVGSDTNSSAVLDGFTVTAGNANGAPPSQYQFGGAMYNYFGSPTVKNTIFSDNSASFGGGMYNYGDEFINQGKIFAPVLTNVVFRNNSAEEGGGMRNENYSSPTLTNVTFESNSATRTGGGMQNFEYSDPVLNNVTFLTNTAGSTGYGGGMFNWAGSNPVLTDVTFSGNTAVSGGGMGNDQSNPTLTNVVFSNNTAVSSTANPPSGGGMFNTASSPNMMNVTFSNNSAEYGGGLFLQSSSSPTLVNVTFSGNSAVDGSGILSRDVDSSPTLTNVTISGNSASIDGGTFANAGSPIIKNSILWGNTGGEIINVNLGVPVVTNSIVQGGHTGTGNIDANPLLDLLANNGGFTQTMALLPGSPAIDAGDDTNCPATDQRGVTRPQGSHCDIGAYEFNPKTLYVKQGTTGANNGSSWTDAYNDLQSALTAASSGDEIWVAAGTYKPTSGADRTVSFVLKNGVAVYGGFAGVESLRDQRNPVTNVTILSGDIGAISDISDNSYHVVVSSGTDNSTILDGFTVTAGNANGPVSSEYLSGGGMYNNEGSPRLNGLIFTGNHAGFGGGMYSQCVLRDSCVVDLILTNVVFSNNTADVGGGVAARSPSYSPAIHHLSLTNVNFINNTADRAGGGMSNNAGKLTLTNVTFTGNTAAGGGGLEHLPFGTSTLTDVTFSNNSVSEGGGGMVIGGEDNTLTVLTNVTFSNNSSAQFGGGIANIRYGDLLLTNTTFKGNSAGTYGGAIYNESGNINLRNSILYGNGEEIYGTADVTHSIVQGGYPGTGNIDADPLLGPLQDNGGFTKTMALLPGSPAIDAGDDADCPATDQRGVTRPQGSHCDIGAFEHFNQAPFDISLSPSLVNENQTAGTTVGTLNTTDPDVGDSHTYTFCGGTDDASFSITGNTLKTAVVFDYETKSSYSVCIRSTDNGNLNTTKAFVISVNNVAEAPTEISLSNSAVNENQPVGTTVGTLSTTEVDTGDSHTYSFCGGTDDASFSITGNTLKTAAIFDFETKSSYSVCIRSTDSGGLNTTKTFAISVNNVAEAPTNISLSNNSVNENQPVGTTVGTLSTTDVDAGDTFTYSFCDGTDDASFSITGNALKTAAVFDFETKSSYSVCIRSTDSGGLNTTKTLVIGVNNVAEAPTNISLSNSAVNENQPVGTTVGTLSTTDSDTGDSHTYSLCGGTDDTFFSVTGNSLKTAAVFDYETKSSYSVCIRSTDSGSLSTTQTFVITVNNLIDTQTFGDVSTTYWAWEFIERLFNAGITGGCNTGVYCPEDQVTRAQMAVFLEKGMAFPSSFSPPNVAPTFSDTVGHWAEDWIEALKNDGVTSGCASGLYCPDAPVTRAQMAVFLLKAKHGVAYIPPAATGVFTDVPVGYWADKWIEQLAAEGITGGCTTGRYCPDEPVTRAQMAVFLVKTFNLP